jgi:DNA-binding PadR family transcriptional regulator
MAMRSRTERKRISGLSELEAVVLGLVWAQGPCTAYSVRLTVKRSLSTQWSGSAGAVYPAVVRLEDRGLIRSRAVLTGRRRSMELEITRSGIGALRTWIGPPIAEIAAGIPVDPLRTRLRFLEVLPPAKRAAFLTDAKKRLEADIRRVDADYRRARRSGASPFTLAMVRGVRYMTRARLKTIAELMAELSR